MTRSRRAAFTIGAVIVLAALGGCGEGGSDGGDPAPREAGEVDVDGDTVRYRSEDGDAVFELDDQGKVRVTDDDGETVLTHGAGTVLPEQWPTELVLPEDLDLTSASSMGVDGQLRVNVTGEATGDPRALHQDLAARLEAAGFEIQGDSYQDAHGEAFATISATAGEDQAAVTVIGTAESLTVSVFLGLAP